MREGRPDERAEARQAARVATLGLGRPIGANEGALFKRGLVYPGVVLVAERVVLVAGRGPRPGAAHPPSHVLPLPAKRDSGYSAWANVALQRRGIYRYPGLAG
jgi:hypothetical protein